MLLHFGLSALLLAGTALASMPYNSTGASYGNGKDDVNKKKPVKTEGEGGVAFIPPKWFAFCGLLNPSYDESDPAYVELFLKGNANGTVHFRPIFRQDLFQTYKHAIDGVMDYKFLKDLVPKANEDFCYSSLSSDRDLNSTAMAMTANEAGTYCFFGYQEIEPTGNGEAPQPIMNARYKTVDYKQCKPVHRKFLYLSLFSSFVGVYWLVRWLRDTRNFTFTQFLLLVWYSAFLVNHPMKQMLFTYCDLIGQYLGEIFSMFSYLFGDGIERSLFNSLILALSLGLGYLRRSSKKLVFLVVLLGWVQSLFIVVVPLIFPFLFLTKSPKAKPLQLVWLLFSYGYLPTLLIIGKFLAYQKYLKTGRAFDSKYMKIKIFIPLLLLSILVNVKFYLRSVPFFYTTEEIAKTLFGVMYFCLLAFSLNRYGRALKDDKAENSENLQKPLPLYKDDPEMGSPADEKL
ncbi:hypothetical protein SPOG_01554 [Schizosaccharomyces cryophilus OY26]|uniref:Uncharacterized protein n=1 Tax=Schizosaccharomyces cryophilus (strain OY26 / ATCC MYA-4695 / CBS 11777 / NBRC 106824 / NRRL Y48691) TaxID=653667 RepID=S9VNW9_SCHCR|nr:uncharacterized protein SPOG_01554 [Schizosaccharomyces cryophilus OY26]EPY49673.1 hypothetical protein SPOG_01554 [Schizosaccharomyces cryophilus OY26]